MGQHDSQGNHQTEGLRRSRKRQPSWLAAVAVVVVIAAAWGVGVALTRRALSTEGFVAELASGAAVQQADDLLNTAVSGAPAFSSWTVEQDGSPVGTVYAIDVDNPFRTSLLARFLLAPAEVRVGAYVDASYGVGRVGLLAPSSPAGAPATLGTYFATWNGMTLYQIATTDTSGPTDPAAGQLGATVPGLMHQLAESIYVHDMGREAFDRLVAQAQNPTLELNKPFPYFTATTVDGQQVTLNTFKGRKTLIAYTEPSCGSCYEKIMTLLNTVKEKQYDLAVLTVIFGDPELAPVKRFISEASTVSSLIVDAEKDLARTMHQLNAPYAVLLDEGQIVVYEGGAGSDTPVYRELEKLMGSAGQG
jgi:peroxiredoxin